jgi:ribosomal protein S18 acetylase RimI-like enzyme
MLQNFGMEIRRVQADQWRELRDIRLRALSDAPDAFETRHEEAVQRPDDWWIDWAARSAEGDRQAMFLASESDGPVGIVGTFIEEGRCSLISMWTDPSVRGRGIGAALVEAAVDFACSARSTELFLEVRLHNEPARRLFERCGFIDTGAGVEEREMKRVL